MSFCFVYKSPGSLLRPAGGTFTELLVASEQERDEKLANGWHKTALEAILAVDGLPKPKTRHKRGEKQAKVRKPAKPFPSPKLVLASPPIESDNGAPTREEMNQKARELGVRFNVRTSDETLMERITQALGDNSGVHQTELR